MTNTLQYSYAKSMTEISMGLQPEYEAMNPQCRIISGSAPVFCIILLMSFGRISTRQIIISTSKGIGL